MSDGAGITTPRAAASEPLRRFLQVARGAGLRVSAAEGIDAARALDVIGYADCAVLKDTLGLVLAKTPDEKALYSEAFDLYFKHEAFSGKEAPDDAAASEAGAQQQGNGSSLSELLTEDDRAGLATAMEVAGRDSGIENIRFFTQKNLYARRILVRMGLREVENEVEALRKGETQPGMERAAFLESRVARLRDAVRDFVERNMLLFARGENEQFREDLLKSARLSNIDRR
ncbi:MAG TPA: hypothetical protein VK642_08050, partial [Burkholderiales bacterium]|nr:hypothetical protein [Burkholderiales bacterium]